MWSRFFRTIAREVASNTPYLKGKYFEWEFLRRLQSFKGIYPSFAAARAAYPAGRLPGYNHEEVGRNRQFNVEDLNAADYPVLFWLSSVLAETKVVFDLGGNIGVGYYAYRRYLTFPADLRWIVCEIPETVLVGRELAAGKGETQISFTELREPSGEVNVYFTAGALQYIEEPFGEIIRGLRTRPKHILVQRVPLCEGPSFITLQNNGLFTVPYQVTNRSEFIQRIALLGYKLMDHWTISRSLQVLGSPEHRVEHYHGMYFRLD